MRFDFALFGYNVGKQTDKQSGQKKKENKRSAASESGGLKHWSGDVCQWPHPTWPDAPPAVGGTLPSWALCPGEQINSPIALGPACIGTDITEGWPPMSYPGVRVFGYCCRRRSTSTVVHFPFPLARAKLIIDKRTPWLHTHFTRLSRADQKNRHLDSSLEPASSQTRRVLSSSQWPISAWQGWAT